MACPRCGFDEGKNLTTAQIIEAARDLLVPHGYCVLGYGVGPDGMLILYRPGAAGPMDREAYREVKALLTEHEHEDVRKAMFSVKDGGHVRPQRHHPMRFTCVRCQRVIDTEAGS